MYFAVVAIEVGRLVWLPQLVERVGVQRHALDTSVLVLQQAGSRSALIAVDPSSVLTSFVFYQILSVYWHPRLSPYSRSPRFYNLFCFF